MLAKYLAVSLVVGAVLGQESENEQSRRLRFRRPKLRPKLVEVDNPDGELKGSPVELRRPTPAEGPIDQFLGEIQQAELVGAFAEEDQDNSLFQSQEVSGLPEINVNSVQSNNNAALKALFATAQREPEGGQPSQEPVQTAAPRRVAPRRRVPGIPRRRPRPNSSQNNDEPRRRPLPPRRPLPEDREEVEPVKTLERYSHKNEDGSFTFGYVGADGSFREETRGADCITRGKYGYIDPDGVKREYSYTSGLPCEVGEGNEDELQNLGEGPNVEDTVDPRERFRQTSNVQLSADQIPAARRRVPRPQRPLRPVETKPQAVRERPAPVQPAADAGIFTNPQVNAIDNSATFANFGSNVQRPTPTIQRRPPSRPAPVSDNALQNLFNIAQDAQAPVTPGSRPAPQLRPVPQSRPAPRPVPQSRPAPSPRPALQARPAPVQSRPVQSRPQSSGFDFDAELKDFTLNKPAITFEQAKGGAEVGPQFQSQLVFDQKTGTFQTQLQQSITGGGQINLRDNSAPSGAVTTAAPTTILGTTARPAPTLGPSTTFNSPQPTTFQASTTRRPVPTQAPSPSPSSRPKQIIPAGTIKLEFEPLNIPPGSSFSTRAPQSPAPSPITPRPVTSFSPRPTTTAAQPPRPSPSLPPRPSPTAAPRPSPTLPPRPTSTLAPRPSPTFAPRPSPTFAPRPTPTLPPQILPSPRPVTTSARPVVLGSSPSSPASPFPTSPRPSPSPSPVPQQGNPDSNTFFVFRPFNQQGRPAPSPIPQSQPFQTRNNPQAFQVRPLPEQPRAIQGSLQSQVPVPQAARPIPQAPRPIQPQLQQTRPGTQPGQQGFGSIPLGLPPQGFGTAPQQGQPIRFNIPQGQGQAPQRFILQGQPPQGSTPQNGRPVPSTPQLQFGFQPVPQQLQASPRPQQLQASPRPQQSAARPQPPAVRQPQAARPQPPRPQQPVRPQPPRPQQPGRQQQPFTAFTAFSAGQPRARPQAAQPRPGAPPQGQRFQGQPQLGVPPSLQQGAFQQFDSRFAPRPQGPPPPQQLRPQQFQGFQNFQPSQLRGA